jgi:pimeloyl-ACP methyl ester carboxylesterase
MSTDTLPGNAHYFTSRDGLELYYRDYGSGRDYGSRRAGTPVICLPGLTRNSRDFEELAEHLSRRRRVLTMDFRGRGHSAHDPAWQNYHPGTYVTDAWTLLDTLRIERVNVIGTSLGGLCAMAMAASHAERLAGVVMNDIGPEVNPAGLARIQAYTGRLGPVTSWDDAVAQTRLVYGEFLPGLTGDAWRRMAQKAYREDEHGVPRLDMDPNIGRAIRENGPMKADPWALFAALAGIPTMLLWGELSDVLTRDIVEKMLAALPALEVVQIPNRGHAPQLDEPESLAAIDGFLSEIP